MFLRRYQRTKDGKTHTYYAWSRVCAPSPGRDSTPSTISASSTTTRNDAGNARSSFTIGRVKTATPPLPRCPGHHSARRP